jgi:glycosyltransferase involved in cell wall biosynthesis
MHILLITTYFEPDQGAASIILTRLAKKLQARGHQLTVLTTLPHYPAGHISEGYRGKFVVVEDREGMCVIQTWLWATPSPKISRKLISQVSFMLTASLRGLMIPRPDVMLIETQPVFTELAGVFLSWFKRVPYVLDVHDPWPDYLLTIGVMTDHHPIYRAARWLVDHTYRRAARIVTLSPGWAELIEQHIGKTDKIRTVFSSIDLDRFQPGRDATAFREKYGLGHARLVTYIGTFGTAYDFTTLLETARCLNNREDVRFVFFGHGSQDDLVRNRLAQGDLLNVEWIHWVDYSEIPLAWAASHVTFYALHRHELYKGFVGTKLFEAMSSGVPVVAAVEGVAAGLLRDSGAGLSVSFGDVEGLADAIRQLLDNPDLHQQCSQAGRAYAERHLDVEAAISAYESILASAIQKD